MTSQKAALVLFRFENRLNWQLALSLKLNNKTYPHCKLVPFKFALWESNTFVITGMLSLAFPLAK